MKIAVAENLRHFLGDLTSEDTQVFAEDDGIGGCWEVVEAVERNGHVVLRLGEFHHSLPTSSEPKDTP